MVATKREKLPVISPNSDSMLSSTEFFNGINALRTLLKVVAMLGIGNEPVPDDLLI
jgi:hypothetical protein